MATSGTITGTAKKDGSANSAYTFWVSWKRNSYSIENNTSNITVSLKIKCTSYAASAYNLDKKPSVTLKVNGASKTPTISIIDTRNYKECTFATWTGNVTHKDDGSLTCPISASFTHYGSNSLDAGTASGNASITTIPRASSLSLSVTSVDVGKPITANISRASSGFTHSVEFYINSTYYKKYTGVGTSQSFTIPDSWYNAMPADDECTAYCRITTYNGNSQIGSQVRESFKVKVPSGIIPSIGTITLNPANITTRDGISRNILVQKNNKIVFSVSGCAAGLGSSIASYKFDVLSGSTVIATTTTTSTSATLGPFSKTGTLKFRLTVTDKRGRSTSNGGKEATWECEAYNPPSFSSFTAYRCNSSGESDDNGTYVKYSLTVSYSSVNNTNKSTVQIFYRNNTSKNWIAASNALTDSTTKSATAVIKNSGGSLLSFDLGSTYSIYAVVTDNYNGSVDSSTVTIFSASRVFNIRKSGEGIAFGKMAESDNLFESKWPAKFDSSIVVGTSTQTSAPVDGIGVHDVRDADITPDSFGDKNVNFYFDKNDDTERWQSILHMKGWTGNYAAWELAGNAHNSSSDNTLKYRQGIGGTWGDWQTVLTNKNIGSYASTVGSCLPISGGTLTGKLTLDGGLYYASGDTAGLDCQNSDIINANGIYFRDASDSAGECINFYNSDGKWDRLYAKSGKLYFNPNKGTSDSLGGYVVYNGSNFRRGTCTLSSSSDTTINFSSALGGTPTVMLTPLTSTQGVIPGKVTSTSESGFTAIIGGSAVGSAKFAYLAVYY